MNIWKETPECALIVPQLLYVSGERFCIFLSMWFYETVTCFLRTLTCDSHGLVFICFSIDMFIWLLKKIYNSSKFYYCSVFFVYYPYFPTFWLADLGFFKLGQIIRVLLYNCSDFIIESYHIFPSYTRKECFLRLSPKLIG